MAWPTARRTWTADTWRLSAKRPFYAWGNTWYNAPCRTWRATKGRPVTVTGAAVPGHVLLVSETGDGVTPFSGALEARRRFPTASLVAGVGGTTHAASLSGVRCVDDAVARYLATGQVPTRRAGSTYDLACGAVTGFFREGGRPVVPR